MTLMRPPGAVISEAAFKPARVLSGWVVRPLSPEGRYPRLKQVSVTAASLGRCACIVAEVFKLALSSSPHQSQVCESSRVGHCVPNSMLDPALPLMPKQAGPT